MAQRLLRIAILLTLTMVLAGRAQPVEADRAPRAFAPWLMGLQEGVVSGLQVQNLDRSQPATILAEFYDQPASSAR